MRVPSCTWECTPLPTPCARQEVRVALIVVVAPALHVVVFARPMIAWVQQSALWLLLGAAHSTRVAVSQPCHCTRDRRVRQLPLCPDHGR